LILDIDGGQGEGGGQIVRTAIALSCAFERDVRIFNIRRGRSSPGLRPQHLAGISLAGEMCDADISGLKVGSTEIVFRPGVSTGGQYEKDIGTAGSISLVLQNCIIPGLFSKSRTQLLIKGGTDVPWSPPMDYLIRVLLPMLKRMGVEVDITIEQRGFYPAGGGSAVVDIAPVDELTGLDLSMRGKMKRIMGTIVSRNLPSHVADRISNSVIKSLAKYPTTKIQIDTEKGPSTGVSVVLSALFENTILASSSLGEKGIPAEKVGETAARNLEEELDSDATLDEHATDQMMPFMFLAKGTSRFRTSDLTLHAKTNISIVKRFVDRDIDIEEEEKSAIVTIG